MKLDKMIVKQTKNKYSLNITVASENPEKVKLLCKYCLHEFPIPFWSLFAKVEAFTYKPKEISLRFKKSQIRELQEWLTSSGSDLILDD